MHGDGGALLAQLQRPWWPTVRLRRLRPVPLLIMPNGLLLRTARNSVAAKIGDAL
jgi:hypothetical protein